MIEPLEARIAPAMVTSTLITYTDLDGDLVKVRSSKAAFTAAGTLFVSPGGGGEQLQLLTLGAGAAGAVITITATVPLGGLGDGFVNVGAINAAGVNLASVTIRGDLGQIDVGSGHPTIAALKTLTVSSLGFFSVTTQDVGGNLTSDFIGNVGKIKVMGTMSVASLQATGKIGTVTVFGSLVGGLGLGMDHTGEINAIGGLGVITIRGSIIGGDGEYSGRVGSEGRIGGVKVGGSILGGEGTHSGEIHAETGIGYVKIKGDVKGGTGAQSGRIDSNDSINLLTIGGSLIGTKHDQTGEIRVSDNIDLLKITGDIRGGGSDSALVDSAIKDTGFVKADSIKVIKIGGSIIAGINDSAGTLINSGAIRMADELEILTIAGSLIGNVSALTGKLTAATISGEDDEFHDASANSDVAIVRITILGSVEYGLIQAGYNTDGVGVDPDAKIGTVIVKGNWIASSMVAGIQSTNTYYGDSDSSDSVIPNPLLPKDPLFTNPSRIASITIGGQVLGTLAGGDNFAFAAQKLGRISIGGRLLPLTAGLDDYTISVATGSDVRVIEFARETILR